MAWCHGCQADHPANFIPVDGPVRPPSDAAVDALTERIGDHTPESVRTNAGSRELALHVLVTREAARQ